MDRRTLLKLMAAVSVTGCALRSKEADRLRVVVAGAGIVGASIAYNLARAGAAVTVIDRQAPASHASRGTFAWINATWAKQPRHYHALNQDSVSDWSDWQAALGIPVRWGGSLEWFNGQARTEALAEQIAEQVAWGEPARMVRASELAELEPALAIDSDVVAAYSPNDGAVDPILATQTLLSAAEQLGAVVQYPSTLTDVQMAGGRLTAVKTDTGVIAADRLVLATGADADAPKRFAGIDVPQRTTPGIIAITQPMPRLLNRIVAAPGIHMHQRNDGRIVLGEQDGAPDNEAHDARLRNRPNEFPSPVIGRQHSARMMGIAVQFLPGIAAAEPDSAVIGWRPLPLDGHPVIGSNPDRQDVYIAIMHSGVSLAPIVGQLAAREIVDRQNVARLDEYRPDRSFDYVRRY